MEPLYVALPQSKLAEKACLGELYAKYKNTIRVITGISSNDRWACMSHMLLAASTPYLQHMRHWRHFVRDRDRSLEFYLEKGSLLQHASTFDVFSDLHALEKAGIVTRDIQTDTRYRRLRTDSAPVAQQGKLTFMH